MNPKYEGRGYMTEALTAFLAFGKTLGIRRVQADTLKENIKSQNVLKRCGFRFLREDGNLWWEIELAEADYIKSLRRAIGSRKIILNCAGALVAKDGKLLFQKRSDNSFLGIFHNHDMMWPNGDRAHTVGAYFTAEIVGGELRVDAESLELRFFAADEIPDLFAEDHRAAVDAYFRGVRHPLLNENSGKT